MNKNKKRYRHLKQKSAKYGAGCFMRNRLAVLRKILKYNEFEDKEVAKFLISSYVGMCTNFDIARQIRSNKPCINRFDWDEMIEDVKAMCIKHGVDFEAYYCMPFERFEDEQHVLFLTYVVDMPHPYGDKTLIRRYLKKSKFLGGCS